MPVQRVDSSRAAGAPTWLRHVVPNHCCFLPAQRAGPRLSRCPSRPGCRLCEHEGKLDMLRPLLHHMRENQKGLGVVAVIARYADRRVRCGGCCIMLDAKQSTGTRLGLWVTAGRLLLGRVCTRPIGHR